jgi:predicted nucleic acid-binding protein
LPLIQVSPDTVLRAVATGRRLRLSLWDALIVESALEGGATVLYTEDLNDGQRIEALVVENPFRE